MPPAVVGEIVSPDKADEIAATRHSVSIVLEDSPLCVTSRRSDEGVEGTPERKRARLLELGAGEGAPLEITDNRLSDNVHPMEPPPGLDPPMSPVEMREGQPGWIRRIAMDYERQLQ